MPFPLLFAVASALSYPPADYELEKSISSPSDSFRVEIYSSEDPKNDGLRLGGKILLSPHTRYDSYFIKT